MITVVAVNNTTSTIKSSNLNSQTSSSIIKCINSHEINTRRKHIKFDERVKCFYYDSDKPILKPRPRQYFLKQTAEFCDLNNNVCHLESFKLSNYPKLCDLIQTEGYIVVKNLSFQKRITIRYTLTEWKTFSDIDAFFINSLDPFRDRFMFSIKIHKSLIENTTESARISFAIKYEFRDRVYWDNNSGNNYKFLLY